MFTKNTGSSDIDFYVCAPHIYRSDLGGMVDNPDRGDSYVPTTSSKLYLPRIGHHVYNGSAWVNEGYLHESEARTNLFDYSSSFVSGTGWLVTSLIGDPALSATGPDGVPLSASKIVPAATSNYHLIRKTVGSIGLTYTLSVFSKADGYDWLIIGDNSASGAGNQRVAFFDVANGVVGSIDDNSTGNVLSAQIEKFGDYFRCSITFVASNAFMDIAVSNVDGNRSFLGDGTSGVLIYGAQLEEASTPSSYIPTSGSTVTRSADTMTASNLPWPAPNALSAKNKLVNTYGWVITDGGGV
jgi:hypothetical protein